MSPAWVVVQLPIRMSSKWLSTSEHFKVSSMEVFALGPRPYEEVFLFGQRTSLEKGWAGPQLNLPLCTPTYSATARCHHADVTEAQGLQWSGVDVGVHGCSSLDKALDH